MASTISRKRRRGVADMTVDELQTLIERVVDRKMSEWASDPRIARRRAAIAANAITTRAEYRAGKVRRGTAKELLAEVE
ncbi:MAG: hypothetical protein HY868_16320 [Chloroflexi bacterium]|nr:hypothetical protein [Chloroflexota bacterium]